MNRKLFRLLLLSGVILAVASVAAILLGRATWGQAAENIPGTWSAVDPDASTFVVVRAYYSDLSQVDELMQFTEPWEVNKVGGYIVLGVTENEIAILESIGFVRIEVDEQVTAEINAPRIDSGSGIPGFACYRTVEETFQTAADLAANHPNLAQWIDVGDSWEKTQNANDGYDMQVLILTNQSTPGPKPKLFITAAIHAREYATAELVTRYAEHLIANYGIDPDITWLLDSHEIHLMLQTNPDGRKYAETGLLWRKNTNNNFCANTNTRGIDLNRNYSYNWGCCGGSSASACSDTFRGPSAGSEPETIAMQSYAQSIFPDQRGSGSTDPAPEDATGVYIDVHSYSQLVLWPWGYTTTDAPNGTDMQTLGRKFAWFNNYTPEQAVELYITDGTTDDFIYGDMGVPAYTFELGTSFFQSCAVFENTIYPDNLPALIYAAKIARTPYMTPAGPDATTVSVSTGSVPAGTVVTLDAVLDDTRFNNSNGTEATQNIAAAEYYIDVPDWVTTTVPLAIPMSPTDGNFNSKVENATAQVDTTGWAGGRHLIYVRGQDTAGNWGAYTAVFLDITTNITPTPSSTPTATPTPTTPTPSPTPTSTVEPAHKIFLPVIHSNSAGSGPTSSADSPASPVARDMAPGRKASKS